MRHTILVLLVGLALPTPSAAAWNAADLAVRGYIEVQDWRQKFGANEAISTGTPEDVWSAGGECVWPDDAAVTTVVSDSAADAAAGTGCKTAYIQCLGADMSPANQTVELDGVTPVTLGTDCRRATRAYCLTAGSGGTNAGTVDVKHGATVIGQIPAGYGQSLTGCDTIPVGKEGRMAGWHCSINKKIAGSMQISLDRRQAGGAWRVMETRDLNSAGGGHFDRRFRAWTALPPGTDLRVRARVMTANDMGASCGFDFLLLDE